MKWDKEFWASRTGKKIYNSWRTITRVGCVPEWHDVEVFCKWALEHGCEDSPGIAKIHKNKIYSPDNCVWRQKKNDSDYITIEFERKWDQTVNKIREYYGMMPLGSNRCPTCGAVLRGERNDNV